MKRLVKSSGRTKKANFSGYPNIVYALEVLSNDQGDDSLADIYSGDGYDLAAIDQFLGSLDEDDFDEFITGDADFADELAASSPAGAEAHRFLNQGF